MKIRRRSRAELGQLRQWNPLPGIDGETFPFDPNVDMFIVVNCKEPTDLGENGVRVMYPDGFITVHSKRELEIDSKVISDAM